MAMRDEPERDLDLSEIETWWPDLHAAHAPQGPTEVIQAAQRRLLQRYGAAIQRYLRAALRSRDEADELYQTFALRFVRGDFRGADPRRGRFRHYLKAALFRLVADFQRQRRRAAQALPDDWAEPNPPACPLEQADEEFLAIWRDELLATAWDALASFQRRTGQHLYTVLAYRISHPGVRSAQIAEHFSGLLNRPVSPQWVRKRLYLAREKLAELLLDEVARSVENPTRDELEQELLDLGLLGHCRSALERRANGTPPGQRPS